MQRLTKFRLLIGALSIGCATTSGYAFVAHQSAAQLQADLATANQRAAQSAGKAASAAERAARLEHQLTAGSVDQTRTSSVIAAFSTQALACEAIKQQLHLKEKTDDHS